MDTIEKVLDFDRHSSLLVRAGKLRNTDPALGAISIDAENDKDLAAFLRSLNEDYDSVRGKLSCMAGTTA
jgi:hypothetical protein